jgi:hypothetical protein
MIIENDINHENSEKRFIRKEFKCDSCFRCFKKLVHALINNIQCPYCYSDNCRQINIIKPNNYREGYNDNYLELDNSSMKTDFTFKEDEKEKSNNNKNSPNFSFLNKKKLLDNIKPFSVSPFAKSVHRHNFDISDILEDGILTTVTEDFFIDNYSSNFVSNFDNPLGRMVFIQMQVNNNSKNKTIPSLSPKDIRQVQKFSMCIDYCKINRNDKNGYELPNCIFCLKDILLETNCFLLRCGHLLHEKCFLDWVKEHKICPVCKFPIIKKGSLRKSSLDIMIDDTIKEESKIEKSCILANRDEKNNNINVDKGLKDDNHIDIVKLIDEQNNNINIIGEKNEELDLFFEDL